MRNLIIIFIIASGYELFYLVPNVEITKAAPDAGLMVLFFYLFYQLVLEKTDYSRLNSFVIWYVVYYLLLVVVQVSIASFYYEQSIIDGLVVSRNQFHYLLVICLAIEFKDDSDVEKFMSALSILSVGIFYLGLINYFGPTIFSHRWSEGHGIRSGITRAYLPGMEIFVLVAIWQMNRFLNAERIKKTCIFFLFVAFSALLFRQTKMHILAASAVCATMLIYHRRFGLLSIGAALLLVVGLITGYNTGENIVSNIFTSAIEDVLESDSSERTTWDDRLEQIEESIDVVKDTFFTGSGGIVLRQVEEETLNAHLHSIQSGMDLGYFVWVKFYGLPGVILMLSLYIYVFRSWLKFRSSSEIPGKYIGDFTFFHFMAIAISMLTIGYFTINGKMAMMCITMAILLHKNQDFNATTK